MELYPHSPTKVLCPCDDCVEQRFDEWWQGTESPYNDAEMLDALQSPLIRRPEPLVLCRHLGHSFFYYHLQCAPIQHEERRVPLADCASETWCCGCGGSVHEPVRERPVDGALLEEEF